MDHSSEGQKDKVRLQQQQEEQPPGSVHGAGPLHRQQPAAVGWPPQQGQQVYMSQPPQAAAGYLGAPSHLGQPPQQHYPGQASLPAATAAAYATTGPVAMDAVALDVAYQQQQQQQQQHRAAQQQLLIRQSYPGYPPTAAVTQAFPPQQPLYFPGQASAAAAPSGLAAAAAGLASYPVVAAGTQQIAPPSFLQPKPGRLPANRPLIKLSVSLIDTYKQINTVYYEERDKRRTKREQEKGKGPGANNNGWDDENYDYIVTSGELFFGRYKIKERIGKGSFGQVVRAEDIETKRDVAIKIIKSKKPFLMQAKTEIELLTHLLEKDVDDQHNIVRLMTHFMYRNHQCLVFEMLSLNLYELLKNTQFGGVSLNLIRKFAKQVLKALLFLARSDVDVIHCDLKPENILLRHPKKSGVKVIDFGSSCRSNKRMYSYIQSRFYRSPEVMLGLPYSVSIDMWSLGCILVEMHTGEPLFSGSDQFDQMQKIVKMLGNVPDPMLQRATDQIKGQFFEKHRTGAGRDEWKIRQTKPSTKGEPVEQPKNPIVPSQDPIATLTEVITAGVRQKKKFPPSEAYNSQRNYEMFIDLVYKMLTYEPEERIKPEEALNHPFILSGEQPQQQQQASNTATAASEIAPMVPRG